MSFNSRRKGNVLPTGVTAFTGAAPQTVTGGVIVMAKPNFSPRPGSLAAHVYALATTSTLTITGKWQVSEDNSTWVDAYRDGRPANVIIVTGTGSAVTDTIRVAAPDSVYSASYARFRLTSGVGVGGGLAVDEASCAYFYLADRNV